MRSESDIGALARRKLAESIAATEAVSRHSDLTDAELLLEVLDGVGDDGVRHVGAVGGKELGGVEARDVDVVRRGLAVEQIGGNGDVSGAGEAVSQPMCCVSIHGSTTRTECRARYRGRDGD